MAGCSNPDKGFKRYKTAFYTIDYPEDWEYAPGTDDIDAVFSERSDDPDRVKPSITVSFGKNSNNNITDDCLSVLKTEIPGFEEIYLNRGNPSRIVFRGDIAGTKRIWDMTIFQGKTDYFVTGLCYEKDYNGMKNLFRTSADSFTVKKNR